jgi:hypothetical protein
MAADFAACRWAKNAAAVTVIGLVALLSDRPSPWREAAVFAQAPLDKLQPGSAAVVPPGQEELLAQMLGLGATLPEQCRFTDGDANGPIIHGDYTCGAEQVTLELHYPADAPASAPRTAKFALVVKSGTPPRELTDAVLSLVRSHEGAFEWKVMQLPRQEGQAGLGEQAKTPSVLLAIAAVAILTALVLGWLVRRMRSHRASSG